MRQIVLYFLFLYSICSFSQKNNVETITIKSKEFTENVECKFSYLITTDKTITASDIEFHPDLKKEYCSYIDDINYQFKELWLFGKIKNETNDTLHLVITMSDNTQMDCYVVSNKNTTYKKLGNLQKSSERYSHEIVNCIPIELLPNDEKEIILHQQIIDPNDAVSKLTLYTKNSFNEMIIAFYKTYHKTRMIFSIVLGAIILILIYNLFLFFRSKSKIYLFYSLYLICTIAYIFIVIDRNQNFYLNNSLLYYGIIREIIYSLSILFYGYFILTVTEFKGKLNKVLLYFTISLFVYFLFIGNNYVTNSYNFSVFDKNVIIVFNCISFTFMFFIIIQLAKKIKITYMKYIFIGSVILFCSYVMQSLFFVFSSYLSGTTFFRLIVRSNFSILLGSFIEVCFFTYALYLKSFQIEKEKIHLENMNEIKSRFFANISHEFRTPLTLIKSPVQSLQAELTNESQQNKLTLIDKNATRMLELVDQLLQLSKIDGDKLKLIVKEGNIFTFLNAVIEPFRYQSLEKKIVFNVSIPTSNEISKYDKDIIEKIVTNLISNAFKYTNENETISFIVSIKNATLKIKVANTGSDVKKEELSKLFERFYQKNLSNQGVGIGLALVKELVELYKGTIFTTLENRELAFIVELPLLESTENELNLSTEETTLDKKITENNENELPILLIIDDNLDIRSILKDIFKKEYQILEAKDGEQGFKIAQKEIPNCIISDVMMPKMDGFEFTKNIKNNELTSFIPVLLLTAKTTDEAHLEGLQSAADAFLTKPFNNEIVKETVYQLISERKKLQILYSQELILRPVDVVLNSIDEKFIEKLQIILDKNLSNSEFSAEGFAKEIGMSRMQLHRKLKSLLGVSSSIFLRNERLKIAIELFKKGNSNISEVAYSVGFSDVSFFSKCFKEMYHYAPTKFIEKNNSHQ